MDETALAVATALAMIDRTEKQSQWFCCRRVYAWPRGGQSAAVRDRRACKKRELRALMESDDRYWRPYWAFNPELGYDTSNVIASRDKRRQGQAVACQSS
jgi:hypothetical protein